MVFGGPRSKSQLKKHENEIGKELFALHLICSYKVHQQFRVMTESYTEEETSTDLWGSSKRALCEQRNIKMINSSIPQNEKLFFFHVIGFCQWELVQMRASRDLERSHRGVTASLSLACTSESPERHVLAAQQPNKATSDFCTKENHGWKKNMFRNARNLKLHHKCVIYNAFKILSFY